MLSIQPNPRDSSDYAQSSPTTSSRATLFKIIVAVGSVVLLVIFVSSGLYYASDNTEPTLPVSLVEPAPAISPVEPAVITKPVSDFIPVEPSPIISPFYSAMNTIKAYPKISLIVGAGVIVTIIAVSVTLALVFRESQPAVVEETPTQNEDVYEEVQSEGFSAWFISLGVIGALALLAAIIALIFNRLGCYTETYKESKMLSEEELGKLGNLKYSKIGEDRLWYFVNSYVNSDKNVTEIKWIVKDMTGADMKNLESTVKNNSLVFFALTKKYKTALPDTGLHIL
jgi:hypothetical protein